MKLIIDGDILAYACSSSVEKAIDWGGDMWTLHADLEEARQKADVNIVDLVDTLGAKEYVLCFSHKENFRRDVYHAYKSNRSVRKPVCYPELVAYLKENWPSECWPNLEGDDVMGILATSCKDCVIVSCDKDMLTIPGRHYNQTHPDVGIVEIDRRMADLQVLVQTLTGDRTDGYPGCPGIGEKRAQAIAEQGWEAVVAAYEKAGLNEHEAIRQARCAYILRKGDYVKSTGAVRLWTPDKARQVA